MIARILLPVLVLAAASGAAARTDPARYMDAKLLAETAAPKPGGTTLVGFRFTPKPGWHGYWSNPGDSGIAPTVRWTAPEGVSFGPLLHPAPTLISAGGIDSFVHEGPHVLLSRMTVGRSVAPGTPIAVKADLSWAACTATQCVPLRATFTLDLVAGDGANGRDASLLRAAAGRLPGVATGATFAVEGGRLRLQLPESLHLNARKTRFFPDEGGYFDSSAAQSSQDEGAILISAPFEREVPGSPSGVVSDGRRSYRVKFVPGPVSAGVEKPEAAEPSVQTTANSPSPGASKIAAPLHPNSGKPRGQAPDQRNWLWLLAAAVAATGAAGWYWRRKR
jgi:DsbC/DsbD-like thiol-disulfide interchange protein